MKLLTFAVATALAASCTTRQSAPPAAARPLEATSPAGPVEWPFEFRWKGASPSTMVRLHIVDEAERPLTGLEARGDHLAAPAELKSTLRAGVRYQWRVARIDENGDEADASPLTAFTIEQN